MLLEAREITKAFGSFRAVDAASVTLEQGDILGLIGPNGAGKSTFFNCLTGDLASTSGKVLFEGQDITELPPEARARLGLARTFQVPQTFEGMSVLENVTLPAVIAGAPRKRAEARARDLLDLLGLADKAKDAPGVLSGGQRQRLAIARALANEPTLVLADEPTGALDSDGAREVLDLFRRLHDHGQSILMVTHSPEVAAGAQRVVRMRDGVVPVAKVSA